MRKKLVLSFIFGFIFLILISCNTKVEAASLDKTEINLYAVNENILQEFPELEIPASYATEYQIKVNDTTTNIEDMGIYTKGSDGVILASSFKLEISDTGLIKPKLIKVTQGGVVIERVYDYGAETVYVRVDGQELQLKVNVIDYSKIYVDNQLKAYIDANFSGMSDYDKALSITQYVASQYAYSIDYQSYRDMYLYKCGDCWGSSNLINRMCELAGLQSHTRNGIQDLGAGSGHTNNAILIDGKVYIVDAGYTGNGNREYDFYLEDPAYTCKLNSDNTVTILQYDGFETEKLIIPSTINGRTVTSIGSYFYNSNTIRPKSIVLPNTITTIAELAFYPGNTYADNLESINIPKSVTSIGYGAFSRCTKVNINCEDGANFIVENNILYNKNKTVLVQVLPIYSGDSTLVIPSTVKQIVKDAFFDISAIKHVTLPSQIEEIDPEAFYASAIEEIIIPKSVKKINYAAFASIDNLLSIEIENGCTAEIGDYAFASCEDLVSAKIPNTITSIGTEAFYNVSDKFTIYGQQDSYAQTYATENSINFSSGAINIVDEFITMKEDTVTYNPEKDVVPNIEVKYLRQTLVEGKDYTITYDENFNIPGEHTLTVNGIGNFSGVATKEYKVEKGESRFTFSCEDVMAGELLNPQISNPDNQQYYFYIYNSRGNTVTTPSAPGVYTYYYSILSNDYFKAKTITQKVTIKQASIPLESITREGQYYNILYVGDSMKLGIVYNPTNTTIVKNVQWRSDNEEIVKVDSNGKITAIGEGTAYIYASIAGKSLSWWIRVYENNNPLKAITINLSNNFMAVGDINTLSINMNPTDATCRSDIEWSSSNNSVVKIDNNGNITALKAGTVTITATKKDKTATCQITVRNKLPFRDIPIDAWYYGAVEFCYGNNMISGVNNTLFAPYEPFTRGMLVTILFRMEGMPYVGGTSKFPDVQNAKAYYYEPVKWAAANGIITGYDNGKFGPEDPITREQLATILYQYCINKGKYKTVYADYSKFTDADKISEFGKWGMNWAVGSGVITGNAETKTLDPQGIATRAEAATMLYKYCLNIK